ncbi:hypothetical protein [Fulvivirga sediminis]|uniref:Lipoprotein n=1 Tax=Fulvivirga sediminis TaxID=2803949 RepID=A0A937F7N0_9BACT|nr:hypothetical protein [Fulvivirga sediminis]MBL3657932.1 hypothetical protein [Fulvivirga sediminis]
MKTKLITILTILFLSTLIYSCSEEEIEPSQYNNKYKGQGSDSMDPHQWD